MKNFIYNCFILIIYYIKTRHKVCLITNKIKELYRTYVRNIHIISEGIYSKSSSNNYNLFRKFGIM
jgi:hypothetical protein